MFSDFVNELLCGRPGNASSNTIFGIVRDRLAGSAYGNQFPDRMEVISGFSKRIGKPDDWGKAPLSLPEAYHPRRLPLRVAFDTRARLMAY